MAYHSKIEQIQKKKTFTVTEPELKHCWFGGAIGIEKIQFVQMCNLVLIYEWNEIH